LSFQLVFSTCPWEEENRIDPNSTYGVGSVQNKEEEQIKVSWSLSSVYGDLVEFFLLYIDSNGTLEIYPNSTQTIKLTENCFTYTKVVKTIQLGVVVKCLNEKEPCYVRRNGSYSLVTQNTHLFIFLVMVALCVLCGVLFGGSGAVAISKHRNNNNTLQPEKEPIV
jgi:hypothetical protein